MVNDFFCFFSSKVVTENGDVEKLTEEKNYSVTIKSLNGEMK